VAFFLEIDVMGESSKEPILPIFWSDNNISLLPGETRQLKATFFKKDLNGDNPVVSYVGINVE
jgi:exo-1,4-beta-D-glucosaminidase